MHRVRTILANTLLVTASIAVFFLGLELFLRVSDVHVHAAALPPVFPAKPPDRFADIPPELLARAQARKALLTLPKEWEYREVHVPGAERAYYWHGILHIHNADLMRHLGPYPPKQPGVFRVIVVGDSLTYGYGIDDKYTVSHLLNDWLSDGAKAEVLNLGVSGYQSEDIASVIDRFLPQLRPDLIVYTVCLNDFLPSGVGEYSYDYAVPLPDNFKTFALTHSRALQFTSDLYDATLRRVHLRRTFFDDILKDFDSYQTRFRRDVAHMQATATAARLPPIIGLVVDQSPDYGAQRDMIAAVAEAAMTKAGFEVVPVGGFYRTYYSDQFSVSRWESHPNEVAHYIWAKMLLPHVRAHLPQATNTARE